MWNDFCLILIGIAMLFGGGDLLITGSIRIARHFKISPFVIGATIIGFGTSAPELAVSIIASLQDSSEVALGNAIGSNIANICLVLGVTSLFGTMAVSKSTFRTETPPLIIATIIMVFFAWDHEVRLLEGGCLLFLMACYLWLAFWKKEEIEFGEPEEEIRFFANSGMKVQIGLVLVGLVILVLGANWLVGGAVGIARAYGISEWIIGITIVAVGTSLPEIISSLIASRRGHHEMSFGNIFGSNIFNICLVIGSASIINPLYIREPIYSDLLAVTLLTFLLILFIRHKLELNPTHGIILLICYTTYITLKSIQII